MEEAVIPLLLMAWIALFGIYTILLYRHGVENGRQQKREELRMGLASALSQPDCSIVDHADGTQTVTMVLPAVETAA